MRYRVYNVECECDEHEKRECGECDGAKKEVATNCAECLLFCEPSDECAEYIQADGTCHFLCEECEGTGLSDVCSNCDGEGWVEFDECQEFASDAYKRAIDA